MIIRCGGCEAAVTVQVLPGEEPTAVPEFPMVALPVALLIGIAGDAE